MSRSIESDAVGRVGGAPIMTLRPAVLKAAAKTAARKRRARRRQREADPAKRRTPMTPADVVLAKALGECRGTSRFVEDMAAQAEHAPALGITDRQRASLWRLRHTFRRQLPSEVLALEAPGAADAPKGRCGG